jgi:hypothetical protein
MKKAPLLLSMTLAALLASSSALWAAGPTPVWEFKFNDVASGVYANNTGSDPNAANARMTMMNLWNTPANHRVAGGPSGLASDMCFSSVPSGSTIAYAYVPGTQIGGIAGYTQITLSGWYKATQPVPITPRYARIFLIGNRNEPNWDQGMVIDFNSQDKGYNQIGMEVNDYYNQEYYGGGDAYAGPVTNDTGVWRFWAVTYDGVSDNLNTKIYMGTQAGAVTLIGQGNQSHIPIPYLQPCPTNNPTGMIYNTGPGADFVLSANSEVNYTDGFTGYQDNIRVWNSLLSLSQIESVRNGDLSHLLGNPAGGNTINCGKGHPTTANPSGSLTLTGAATLSNDGFTGSTIAVSAVNITGANASKFHVSGTIPATLTGGGAGKSYNILFDGGTPGIYSTAVSFVTDQGNVGYTLNARVLYQGDADENGTVAFADYQALEAGFGTGTTWAQGNFDGVGVTSFADYQLLEANFGKVITPEPATLCLLVLGGLGLIRRR